jgi:hypothetical protein
MSVRSALAAAHPRKHRGQHGTAVHSSQLAAKVRLRRALIAALGGPAAVDVLECHAGPGVLRTLCYRGVRSTLSIDKDPESPDAVHADSRYILRSRTLDLQRFNLFDVDPFGSPFHHLWILAQRRKLAPGERIGIAVTTGHLGSQAGRRASVAEKGLAIPTPLLRALGINPTAAVEHFITINGERTLRLVVSSWFAPARIVHWIPFSFAQMRYDAVVLEG